MSTENLTTNLSDLLPVTEHESEGIYTDDEDDERRKLMMSWKAEGSSDQ